MYCVAVCATDPANPVSIDARPPSSAGTNFVATTRPRPNTSLPIQHSAWIRTRGVLAHNVANAINENNAAAPPPRRSDFFEFFPHSRFHTRGTSKCRRPNNASPVCAQQVGVSESNLRGTGHTETLRPHAPLVCASSNEIFHITFITLFAFFRGWC